MCFDDSNFAAKVIKKTPPNGEKGGEKQYKDYEKNPTLFFLNASSIGIRCKNKHYFHSRHIFSGFCGSFFHLFAPCRYNTPYLPDDEPRLSRQQSLLGGHNELTSVIQVAVHVVSTVHHVHGASDGIDGHVRGFSLVVCSSLSASSVRLSSFRMCHFLVI